MKKSIFDLLFTRDRNKGNINYCHEPTRPKRRRYFNKNILILNINLVYENSVALESDYNFRSAQSDIEIPKTRKRKAEGEDGDKGGSTATLSLDPLAMTKENMSTSRRPAGTKYL